MSFQQTAGVQLPELSAAKRALLEARLRGQHRPSPLVRRAHAGDVPLSFAQERLWFLDRLQPGSTAYNVSSAIRLPGGVDEAALERALGEVVCRHETLRTTFREQDGIPVQVVAPFTRFVLSVVDLSVLSPAAREAEVARRAADNAGRSFDLVAGPLFRGTLLRLGADGHVLLLCMHHIISDGWSIGVLRREVTALYGAYREGRASPFPELPLQYADYAVWQREQARGGSLERQLAYWKGQLAGAPELLELPTDHPRPPAPSFRGDAVPVAWPAGQLEGLRELARHEGTTLFMVVLAGFQALLSRYSGTPDVVVGTPVAGRTHNEMEGLIGFFVNTLVLRTDLSDDPSLREVLRRVRETVLGAYEHQDLPFERLVAELQPERSLSHAPFFQVMLTLDNAEAAADGPAGQPRSAVVFGPAPAKFDLTLSLAATPGGLRGELVYSADLFKRGTAERMLERLGRVLEQVAGRADLRLSEVDLASEDERVRMAEWNRTEAEYPSDRCVHQLFEEQAGRTPEAVAIVFEDAALTYRELDERANRLANRLVRLGVGPEVRVGLCMERSLETVISLLGVLKAGGAYVPLDPGYPAARLQQMIADAGATVVLTQEKVLGRLPMLDGVRIVSVEAAWAEIAAESAEPLANRATPDGLAYAIFTSGSTGTPKAVGIEHRALVNHMAWFNRAYGMTAADRVLQKTPINFDASVWEFYAPLLVGGELVVARHDGERDTRYLARILRDRGITTVQLVPSLFRVLMDEPEFAECGGLRQLFCGGETLSGELAGRFGRIHPHARLVNLYGPAECCIDATTHACTASDAARAVVPIGRPVSNTRTYVLDGAPGPMPAGFPGELFIGGVQVGRGYLGRPALTAENFVPDPFSFDPGARMYRTGDRARWTEGGTLEYLGRVDQQVKVRGIRIEPGEIEALLRRDAAVADCAVVVREDVLGDRRLVAYVVGGVDVEVLRARLRGSLPEYMVPAAFVVMDRLPLTRNGKLDRRTLPAPGLGSAEDRYVAPRTPTEEVLAGIWAEVLRVERVGVEASFFALGGHSLLAMRVVSRVGKAFDVELPLRTLFESPTVEELAQAVEALRRADLPPLPPVVPVDRAGSLPLSFAQERLWFLDRLRPGSSAYNIPAALRLSGALDVAALERSLGEVVRRHESLRTTFAQIDGTPVQVVAPFTGFALPVEDLSPLSEAEREAAVRHRASEEAARPFDLAAGPLFRAVLLGLGAEEHVLLLSMHHVISDGWSMGVLYRELAALYAAFRAGGESPLAALPVQYADYAVWQREQLRGETLERQLTYWRERLAGAPELLELPTDFPRPPVSSFRGGAVSAEFPAALLEGLRALARSEGATLYMVALAAFQVVLAKYASSGDVVMGSPIAGRTRHEVEGLIGFFVNTLVLRTDLSGDPSFRDVVRRVREATLGAYEHQDVPFERLVAELQPERSMSHAPLFQVMFSLDDVDAAPGDLPGLVVRAVDAGPAPAKFDLSLGLAVTPHGIAAGLVYSADLFEHGAAERMLERLGRVLDQVAGRADLRLSEVDLAGEDERARVAEWNRTEAEVPSDRCVHQLFEEQAGRTPEAVAIVFEDAALTYRELDERANRLANRLVRLGVGPEVRVGLCMERSLETVISLFGVLKAGGAYVPLDPGYPAARLQQMIADAGATVVLTQEKVLGRLPMLDGLGIVSVEAAWAEIEAESAEPPANRATPDGLAYAIFTSGSTGTPKAVGIEHRALVNHMAWFNRAYGMTAADRVLQKTPINFDASVWEFYAPLLVGGELVVARHDGERDTRYLARILRDHGITTLQVVPSLFRVLMDEPEFAECGGLRQLFCGGEALSGELAGRFGRIHPHARLVNLYGPAECCIDAAAHVCTADDAARAVVPIGRPVPNTRAYVLDRATGPVPAGLPGELFIGGVQVGRGYLGRPALTAERFVPDPFSSDPGARMYRTGDRARWTEDGTLEYLGRVDRQVKVRGIRIEPGEIEGLLRRDAAVADCSVVVREDAGENRLVAYVVGDIGNAAADRSGVSDVLRAHLRRSLPEYMVPAAFVVLDRLPLTPNGKLDVKALPAPDLAGSVGEYVAPRTVAEEVLAAIWAEVLRVERVGVRDDFFALGGHSLLATRLMSRVAQAFGVELPLRALFEAPTLAELAREMEGAAGRAASPPMAALGREEGERVTDFPLSFAQQRLWVVHRLDPESAAYNLPYALRLRGTLDLEVLARALAALARRHETLRTVFPEHGGVPVQRVLPAGPVPLDVIDLRTLPEEERDAEAARLALEEAARPFDLLAGPLMRLTLLRLGEADTVALFTLHHVVSDGWSQDVLVRDLSELYAAGAEWRAPALPPLPVQYADHAVWQREWLSGEVLEAHLAWWRERLAGAPHLLELPTDRPRPPALSDRADRVTLALSAGTTRALRALSRGGGATLFMTFLAAFQAVLSRWAGEEDVVVGTPVAGRTRPEVENLIGFFVNLLALRTDLSGDPSFRALIGRVREGVLEAHARQDVPLETLVDELRPERTPAVTPFFQVLFAVQPPARESLRLGELEIAPAGGGVDAAKYDLSLEMADDGERLLGSLLYRTDLFDPGTAARLMEHLARVLEQVAADPEAPLSRLALLDAAERALVVDAWNRTAAPYPAERCIHQLFEAQAARTPDAVAVIYGDDSLTYRELDARANRLARHLAGLGVGPEVRVGLCLERSLELMACILGVMKAGGAYVPVDSSHPAERIGYVFEDSGVSVVLTQERLRERVPALADVAVVRVDAEWECIAAEPADTPASTVTSENLAYVIYTSGSTGRPKGVAMHHRGVVNYIAWGIRFYGADRGNGAPVFTSMAVDLTITNLLPLFAGLPVRFLPEENPVEALAAVLCAKPGFGLIKITPIHLSLLTPMLTPEEARSAARTLVIGADFLPAEPTVWWQDHAPEVRLMNEYGPTETVVGCSAYVLPNGLHRHGPIPVGGPIQNLTFFVLDARMEPVPVGLPGELYIGGAGVARGYLGRPGLSAEKFVPDPFAGGGARMYRTGDRARWLEGGNLMILGRTDHQVKLRGYRVELGEIEAVLRRHPAVSGCLVVVREDRPGDRRLVAYMVADTDDRALREHLRTSLPEYMVPSAFVRLDTLPKTATGKVDPRTLPVPEYGAGEARYVAPRTPVEEALAKAWAEVLGVERVGVDDVFFELGGDSILAIQAASRARWAGVEVAPLQILEHRTVAGVAAAVARGRGAGARAAEQGRVTGSVALTPIQAAFFSREHPAVAHHNLSVLMAVDAAVTDAVLEPALRAVLEHHDALRLRYRRTEAGWEQGHADEHGITLERADLSGLAPGERDRAQEAVAERWQASLDLEHGPLGRAVLFDRGEEGRALLLLLHHLLVDGVSWRILREDLDRACAQAGRGLPVDLGPKSTSFREWAQALEVYAAGEALGQADFWLTQGADGVPSLPYEGEGELDVGSARYVTVQMDVEETRFLLQDVPAAYGTQINDVLLCALAEAVGAWTGGTRTRVALESHGRAEQVGAGVELTRSVGWFTSIYPVVLDTSGAADSAERLSRIQTQLRAVPALGVGYGALRWLGPDRELRQALAAQPEPELVFNYLGQFDQGLAPGLAIRFAGGPKGHDIADANHRVYPLAVSGTVIGGCLALHWRYGEAAHRAETIERVANACLEALRSLIAHAAGLRAR